MKEEQLFWIKFVVFHSSKNVIGNDTMEVPYCGIMDGWGIKSFPTVWFFIGKNFPKLETCIRPIKVFRNAVVYHPLSRKWKKVLRVDWITEYSVLNILKWRIWIGARSYHTAGCRRTSSEIPRLTTCMLGGSACRWTSNWSDEVTTRSYRASLIFGGTQYPHTASVRWSIDITWGTNTFGAIRILRYKI